MDRSDELRDNRPADAATDGDDRTARDGDVLGLGGAPVPKAPGDPTTEYDEESVAQRRNRALREEEVRRPSNDQHGATGVDIGGGHGTDVSGD